MARREAARTESRKTGRTPKNPIPGPEAVRGAGGQILKKREENRKKLAETEKRDAAD